ncbi:MAG: indolepyruvate ferredoxin oxidoreductase subunit alpha [Anaerolineae bacterium]|nr:indolepyruvate ferredoxin oxidoreductase subunit alpha [Anaerolineae bacterium]
MTRKLLTGNEALALGALHAGIRVAAGYPGTPSTGALEHLLAVAPPEVHVEWSVNEKVALEIAAGAAWAGQRALCTMKMSGLNVASDSLYSVAYSGVVGGLVVYVADDPGVSAGMCEQDSRGFALLADLPLLDPPSVPDAYRLTRLAFDLSEAVGTPVLVRLTTAIAHSSAPVEVGEPLGLPPREPQLLRDIARFTKAGAAICMQQHRDLIARLERAGEWIREAGLNILALGHRGGLGIIAGGVPVSYLDEGLQFLAPYGLDPEAVSVLRVLAPHPFPDQEVRRLLEHVGVVLVLEELEPHLERSVYVAAQQAGFAGRIVGKLDGTLPRVGEYDVRHVVQGIAKALGLALPADLFTADEGPERLAAPRPITVCPGCPHRGTFIALQRAIRRSGYRRDQVMVTGDIGCTILGMNPPFEVVWNEVAMGASIGLAQGYVHAGVQTPVIATIGDSTFFHAGIPALINAVQYGVPLTVIVMDNGWTAMTGMQFNPGTDAALQPSGNRRVDLARLIPALGVDHFFEVDPFDLDGTTAVIQRALTLPGVKVILARQECAIQAGRRGLRAGRVQVVPENCNLCRVCILQTGCPAIELGTEAIHIDPALCYGCGLCAQVCQRGAILRAERTFSETGRG